MKFLSVMASIGLSARASVCKPSKTCLIAAAGLFGAAGTFAPGAAPCAAATIPLHQLNNGTSPALNGTLAPAISDGQIVFNDENGNVYTENADGSGLTQVINQQTAVPGGMPAGTPSTFDMSYGSQERIGAGEVVFIGTNSSTAGDTSGYGLYSVPVGGGAVTLLANEATMVNGSLIGGSSNPAAFPFDFQVGATGQVVFEVSQQLYSVPANGGTVTCVATDICDNQTLGSTVFENAAISGNTVAFPAGTFGGTRIVTTPLPSNPNSFTTVASSSQYDGFSLGGLPAQDGNTTVFYAQNSNDTVTGIFTSNGTALFTNTATLTLGGNGHGPQVAADHGLVVFEATNSSNQVGLYEVSETGGAITQIVISGQVLPQGTVQSVDMGAHPLSNGQLVFSMEINFGAQLWEADLVTNPATLTDTHDFNGDGTSDILWRQTGTGQLAMWLMSNGQLSSGANFAQVQGIWSIVGTRDFNGDGDADILWLDNTGNLAIWEMNGAALSSAISLGNVGTQWSVAGTGDFNNDGTGDILWRDSSGNLALWLISNGQFSSSTSFGQVPTTWSVTETGDFNADGMSDILWIDQSGDLAIWFMNGLSVDSYGSLGNVGTTWHVKGENAD